MEETEGVVQINDKLKSINSPSIWVRQCSQVNMSIGVSGTMEP